MSLIKLWFVRSTVVVEQWTNMIFHQPFVIQIPHQFVKPEIFGVFIFSSACN